MAKQQGEERAPARSDDNGQQLVRVDMAPVVAQPDFVSQATSVEVGRAVAEVQAAVIVAQNRKRNITEAQRDMLRACQTPELAEIAFWKFPRGRDTITGPTVQLMREIMRCFGNCQSGVTELRRDAYASEMQAWAWDLEKNVRQVTTFIQPHIVERSEDKGGNKDLGEGQIRDIYELNANMAARREREMIRRILPAWFVEMAIAECHRTLKGDSREEFRERVGRSVALFDELGVSQPMLEQRLGAVRSAWAPIDLAQLRMIYKSIDRGETTAEAAFGGAAQAGAGSAAGALADAAKAAQDRAAEEPQQPRRGGRRRPQPGRPSQPSEPEESAGAAFEDAPPMGEHGDR